MAPDTDSFDLASHVVDHPGFLTQGSEWLIAIGVLGALGAAVVGFLDLLAIPTGTTAFRTGLLHMGLNLTVTGAYVGNLFWRHGDYTHGHPVGAGPLTLSVISLAILSVSGFLGGKLAYRYGVRVADEGTQAEGFTTTSTAAASLALRCSDGPPRRAWRWLFRRNCAAARPPASGRTGGWW